MFNIKNINKQPNSRIIYAFRKRSQITKTENTLKSTLFHFLLIPDTYLIKLG
jgi:hypothetical protein